MALPINLDMDVLRTFVTGIDLGSFAKAATRLGRSPSAISLQLRKLEDQVGQPLLRRNGRGLALTEPGELLLGYARRLLDLNDAAVSAVAVPALSGWVRLGLPQDFTETELPAVLARFARLHPAVRVEAHVERDAVLRAEVEAGRLDLALVWDAAPAVGEGTLVSELPMVWVGPRGHAGLAAQRPLPLALFGPPCLFRHVATEALDAAGVPWRIAFSSPGLAGLWAAVAAGLGVGLRTPHGLPPSLRPLDPDEAGLPPLPSLRLRLVRGPSAADPAVERFAELLGATLAEASRTTAPLP
ncbi:LysR family transcriptional regulator [Methylorubrum populi]|uniref:LysR family transcriptional regulator n=1 Tax=Methylorubrum populi TaxID=223967 RepID=A0A160PAZ4_9HYPH|nr:LysR substrate-binding domain-containing protein [Methylorubrum populi]BAU89396.1 LysR family transcriptional regulator [Methylorubrum populi]